LILCAALAAGSGFEKASALYRRRDFAGAEQAFRQLLVSHPKSPRARMELARTLIELKRVPEAINELKSAMALNPGDPEVAFQVGRILQGLAASRLARLERAAPDSAELRELLGRQYEAAGKLDRALAEYNAALAREPSRNGLHFLAGNVLWKMGENQKALAEIRTELERNPSHSLANLRAGQILISQGEAEKAIERLRAALAGDAALLEARRELGRALRQAGRYAEALGHFREIARVRPDDDSVHAQLAAVYRGLGDESAARRELQIHKGILDRKRTAARKSFEEQTR
jgi:tetratricopeptide (TPR) repeat protein